MNKRLKDLTLYVIIALVVCLGGREIIRLNGGFQHIINGASTSVLDRICSSNPNDPSCLATQKVLYCDEHPKDVWCESSNSNANSNIATNSNSNANTNTRSKHRKVTTP